ncbi:LAT2 domain-containing protein isoform X2 [Mugil cephalus]|uniref:LAT2 domain-containing protein isoform X2 n=1 Tax=Mugil cephalus TaxID=48193 RepID=UPI001FB67470|nr:LAT2 domain-containing protein isoform X2 [Mugil cephalus]
MTENPVLLAAVLTVVSVIILSVVVVLCLRCKRKSKVIHEEPQVYEPQTFQRGGSQFAVMQSKTVTRANQRSTTIVHPEEPDQPGVQTVSSSLEHDYVAPIAMSVYENEKPVERAGEEAPGIYGNVFNSLPIDDDDYENAEYLDQVAKEQEDDEPDYVNAPEHEGGEIM